MTLNCLQVKQSVCLLCSVSLCVCRVPSGPRSAAGHSAGHRNTTTWESCSQTEAHRGGLQGDKHLLYTQFTLSSVLCRFNITSSTKQQNSSMLFVCFILLALVWHVFRGEEQVSAASRMSRHGGLSSDQRQRGSGHIVGFVPQYIYLAELWLGLSLYKCTMCACSETVSCVLNALKCME